MPKTPLESFFDRVFDAVSDAAEDLVHDASKQARENMRRISRQMDQATVPEPPSRGRRRAQKAQGPVRNPNRPYPPQLTLYDVLECSPRASQETISAAFRSLSTRFHPDTGKVKSDTRYKDITAAWNVLKDPVKRKKYDREIGLI